MLWEVIDTLNGTTKRRNLIRNRINVTIGTTVGILLGAAVGILFAPKSGKETREDIKSVAEIGIVNAGEVAHQAAKFVKKEAAAVKEKVKDLKAHMKHSEEIIEQAVEDLVEESKTTS